MPYCRQCGKEVNAGEIFCRFCGAKLSPAQAGSQNPSSSSAAREEDLALFIGKNAEKYLIKFRKFAKNGEDSFVTTWHWPAFFFSFWWTLYRKLYGWALLVLFLGCVPYLGFLVMIAFGMSANYIYYRHAKKKLIEVKSLSASEVERAVAVARAGGVNNVAVVLVPIAVIALLGILAAVAIPQFVSYRQRSFDLKAKHEIQDACARGIAFFAVRPEIAEIAPEDFLDAGLVRSPDVELMLLDGRRETFSLSAKHKKGRKLYLTDNQCTLTEEQRSGNGEEQTKL
ncbi:MAG TPA: zinc-ribbon domain-containing protein [Nitrospirota bacterium]|nr:zinc-ribbon domain-containing protein [Nitrospirota bacterium]